VQIQDDDELLRRLAPDHVSEGHANSLAFSKKFPYEISVNLSRMTTIEKTLEEKPHFGIGRLNVGVVRRLGLTVQHAPVKGNEAHCLIKGEYSKAAAKNLAKATTVIRLPVGSS
jgi:hypothetical protein